MTAPKPCGSRIPPTWSVPLSPPDYDNLAKSCITREIADAAMLRRVDESEGRQVLGQFDALARSSFVRHARSISV